MHTQFYFHTVQLLPQISHSKGLSPMCTGLCKPNLCPFAVNTLR
jgi:hypothetical protein